MLALSSSQFDPTEILARAMSRHMIQFGPPGFWNLPRTCLKLNAPKAVEH
jgi:hypothetical protein